MTKISLQYKDPKDLIPNPNNARTHSAKQIKQIAASIKSYGFMAPVLIDENNAILAGHARTRAALELALETVPCVISTHLTDTQKRAYLLTDNRIAQNADWDQRKLAQELEMLIDLDFDVSLTGFEVAEIDLAISSLAEEAEDQKNNIPSLTRNTIIKPGDLWALGEHRILCGDALSPDSYSCLMNGRKANLIITDPPYNVPISGHVSSASHHREFAMASGEMNEREFTAFLEKTFENMIATSHLGSIHFIFMDWRHMREMLNAGKLYTQLKNLCVWVKDNGGMGSFYRSRHELVFVFKNGDAKNTNNFLLGESGRYRTNVWEYAGINSFARRDGNKEKPEHPTIKPVNLLADAIRDCSRHKDIVLDPFLGSGSTLIACHETKRICYGMEIDPLYVDLCIRRFTDHTGIKAVRLEDGADFHTTKGG